MHKFLKARGEYLDNTRLHINGSREWVVRFRDGMLSSAAAVEFSTLTLAALEPGARQPKEAISGSGAAVTAPQRVGEFPVLLIQVPSPPV